jgi:zinc transporter
MQGAKALSNGCPLFAFAFGDGLGQSLSDLAEVDIAVSGPGFVWIHLDLGDAAAQAWLRRRPWPPDVIEMVAAPIQRGKLFATPDLLYGHLRDFRSGPGTAALQAGSLCLVASRQLIVTGRRIPLLSVEELRRRVEARTVLPESPFSLITEFLRALNDIGEGLLQAASERLRTMESKVLHRNGAGNREVIFEMRSGSIEVARDMAYKRTAMLDLAREPPAVFPADEFERLSRQIHRYAALVEDAQEFADQCQFLLEEFRAQVEEETNRNLFILTMFSAICLPATLITGIWGMNLTDIPFSNSASGFWVVGGLIAVAVGVAGIVLSRLRSSYRVHRRR